MPTSHGKRVISASSVGLAELILFISVPPGVTFSEARQTDLARHGVAPMPREMAFPVPKGENWHDLYDYIRCGCSRLRLDPLRLWDLPVPRREARRVTPLRE